VKGSATMNRMLNESPYGVPDADQERIMPAKIAMARKKKIALVAHESDKGKSCNLKILTVTISARSAVRSVETPRHLIAHTVHDHSVHQMTTVNLSAILRNSTTK
jgi:signal transduction histidine kinase